MPPLPGFIGPGYRTRSPVANCDELINLYLEAATPPTRPPTLTLYGTAGLRRAWTLPEGPIRGLYTTTTGRLFAACGAQVVELFPDGTQTTRGPITLGLSKVTFADNGTAMMLVDGPHGYVVTLATNTVDPITDPAFYGADHVVYLGGYFVLNQPSTGTFYWTDLLSTTFDALNFATAEARADPIVGLLADHEELWIFGRQTVQVFHASGDVFQPFLPLRGATIERGLAATHGLAALDNTVYWLASSPLGDGIVYRAQGYTPQRISNHAIEQTMNALPLDDAVAYAYTASGHSALVLNFPTSNLTLVYDAATDSWHRRAWLADDGTLARHRAQVHSFAFGRHWVGDHTLPYVYELDQDVATDDGRPIVRRRTAPHVRQEQERLFVSGLRLLAEVGHGEATGLSSATQPQAVLDISRDGGYTFGAERQASLGAQGQYRTRCEWRRLGTFRDGVLRVTITAPVPVALVEATLL